ncbi:MAG: hypothetical protein AAB037_00010 [Chloroflexota bacterium]
MRFLFVAKVCLILTLIVTLVVPAGTALAHARRDVGKYQFVVGWAVEPAFAGEKNGVSLRVTNRETNQQVSGLENTLQVEIHHGTNKTIKSLRAVFGTPGSYQADLIPTAQGNYEFHFEGTVEGLEVEEEFISGPGQFDQVESSADVQFPIKLRDASEFEAALQGAQNAAQQAQDAASSAKILAMLGVVLGAMGIALGVIRMRKR